MNVLIGDLGGTKTLLAVVSSETGPRFFRHERLFPSASYVNLEAIIAEYLGEIELKIDRACFAIAGPITGRQARVTNLPWMVDADKIQQNFVIHDVRLLNDLESVAYAIPIFELDDLHTVYEAKGETNGNIAVVAPGTGLGEVFLTHDGAKYTVHASEGSHVSFSPINELQQELLTFMRDKKGFTHVSVERVCSGGLGIPNLYSFFKETGKADEPKWLAEKLKNCDDITPIIFETAENRNNPCEICQKVVDTFCDILASEAGNLALKVLSLGGIFLGGGISPRIIPRFQDPRFAGIVRDKGRFQEFLSRIPIRVILNKKAGLLGAASIGLQDLR